jgi:hypothetical protein
MRLTKIKTGYITESVRFCAPIKFTLKELIWQRIDYSTRIHTLASH